MESKKTSFWITYRDPESYPTASDAYGRWVCTFTDRSRIARICQDAVMKHIVHECRLGTVLFLLKWNRSCRAGKDFTIPDLKRSDS